MNGVGGNGQTKINIHYYMGIAMAQFPNTAAYSVQCNRLRPNSCCYQRNNCWSVYCNDDRYANGQRGHLMAKTKGARNSNRQNGKASKKHPLKFDRIKRKLVRVNA